VPLGTKSGFIRRVCIILHGQLSERRFDGFGRQRSRSAKETANGNHCATRVDAECQASYISSLSLSLSFSVSFLPTNPSLNLGRFTWGFVLFGRSRRSCAPFPANLSRVLRVAIPQLVFQFSVSCLRFAAGIWRRELFIRKIAGCRPDLNARSLPNRLRECHGPFIS